jgi:hypothetical protein
MLRFLLCAGCFFSAILPVTAQVIVSQRTQLIGRQRITDIMVDEVLPSPRPTGTEKKVQGPAELVTLKAKDWNAGMRFKDDKGNVWRLVYGPAVLQSPAELNGALTNAADGRVLFLTSSGTLFVKLPPSSSK